MRLAIAATGTTLDSKYESRFGRAQGFIIIEVESGEFEYLDNSDNSQAEHGSGVQTVQSLSTNKVDVVVASHIGPKAAQALIRAKIPAYHCEAATVEEAYQKFKEGSLATINLAAGPNL